MYQGNQQPNRVLRAWLNVVKSVLEQASLEKDIYDRAENDTRQELLARIQYLKGEKERLKDILFSRHQVSNGLPPEI